MNDVGDARSFTLKRRLRRREREEPEWERKLLVAAAENEEDRERREVFTRGKKADSLRSRRRWLAAHVWTLL